MVQGYQALAKNSQSIQAKVGEAAKSSNRKPEEIQIVAVTKSVDIETTRQVFQLGYQHLAENRVSQLLEKQAALQDCASVKWHFIGHLQRRKVKLVINKIDYFHALDRLSLAEEIQKRAEREIRCFVQVNVSNEASKQGLAIDEVINFIKELKAFSKIKVVGLMTMAPKNASDETLHQFFTTLKRLQMRIEALKMPYAPCTELSMGMSQDYPIAIQEGATFVRIGTAFFIN